jgi:1-deoxy-D-xylulose-5-phosphate reductoisomerase
VVINAANEAAIEKFLSGKNGFLDIAKDIITAYEKFSYEPQNIDEVFAIDTEVRRFVESLA